jgi:hypothetical protein
MGGYINAGVHKKKKLQEYNHAIPTQLQRCPFSPEPKQFGSKTQTPLPPDKSPEIDAKGIKRIQKIVGSILYYAHAVDMTVLAALSTIAIKQTKATQQTNDWCIQILDYLASNQDAKVRFLASDIVMNIHSDASYLSESGAQSWACGHFFMGWMPKNGEPIRLNGTFYASSTIMRFVIASAAEAELGPLFHNCQTGMIF